MASSPPPDQPQTRDGTGAGSASKISPELRFLVEQAGDAEEGHRILQAYYTFAGGTPESATVQFALLATALVRANLAAVAKLTDLSQQRPSGGCDRGGDERGSLPSVGGSGANEVIGAAVRKALVGLAGPLDQMHADVKSLRDEVKRAQTSRWIGVALFAAGLLGGYWLHR